MTKDLISQRNPKQSKSHTVFLNWTYQQVLGSYVWFRGAVQEPPTHLQQGTGHLDVVMGKVFQEHLKSIIKYKTFNTKMVFQNDNWTAHVCKAAKDKRCKNLQDCILKFNFYGKSMMPVPFFDQKNYATYPSEWMKKSKTKKLGVLKPWSFGYLSCLMFILLRARTTAFCFSACFLMFPYFYSMY